jgi:hypothetical protein
MNSAMPPARSRTLLLTFLTPVVLMAFTLYAAHKTGQPLGNWTRDTTSVAKVSPLTGIISNIGILIWWVAVAVCCFVAVALRRFGRVQDFRFLLATGLVTGMLVLDDFFLFHDRLGYRFFGLRENVVYCIIFGIGALYIWIFRRELFRRDSAMLFVAGALITASVLTDMAYGDHQQLASQWFFAFEDGLKLLGICAWCNYCLRRSMHALREAVPSPVSS